MIGERYPTKACVVLPTYNEADNITTVLDRIFDQQKHLPDVRLQVLVVDDSSPDGTAQRVSAYKEHQPNTHLLLRTEKEGLGAAYIAGMTHALDRLRPDIIMEMDADLSHDPDDIPRLITAVLEGYDFVIGSRYVKGGSIPSDWGLKRKMFSKSANAYLRTMLGIQKVKDCTGGFRAIRASTLEQIDLQDLQVKGYAFQIALLHAAMRSGARIGEVPIAFHDRTQGESKLRFKDMVELGLIVLPLWRASQKQRSRRREIQRTPMPLPEEDR